MAVSGATGRGAWLGASRVLGRPVAFEENPHVCGKSLTGTMTGRSVLLTWRDCAACAVAQAPDRPERRQ
ncbi:hypothetical protein [Micromonospora aurantiaca (nom. illeg.)]|uniref:hypothetical protein n=1 Tax=Micromonospora aurantiaca (nom. illeg.) TaxID=47850 RepID=UPI0016570E67|nr:hypothetical protein [Micromonospora aurantiaca]MBC9000468.1 hypothetical protein [Micromonospora aurantiaca]